MNAEYRHPRVAALAQAMQDAMATDLTDDEAEARLQIVESIAVTGLPVRPTTAEFYEVMADVAVKCASSYEALDLEAIARMTLRALGHDLSEPPGGFRRMLAAGRIERRRRAQA